MFFLIILGYSRINWQQKINSVFSFLVLANEYNRDAINQKGSESSDEQKLEPVVFAKNPLTLSKLSERQFEKFGDEIPYDKQITRKQKVKRHVCNKCLWS